MNQVRFVPLNVTSEAAEGETIFDAARRIHAPLGNACGGIGICGRCRIRVIEGSLTPPTDLEERLDLEAGERLACQTVVLGACCITTSYW